MLNYPKKATKRTGLKRKTIKTKVVERNSVKRPKLITVAKKPIEKPQAKRTGLKRKFINNVIIDENSWSQSQKALKNYTKLFEIPIINKNYASIQLNGTKHIVEHILNKQLDEIVGLKYIETLKVTFKKTIIQDNESKTTYKTGHFNSKTKTIISKNTINHSIETSKEEILNIIDVWLSEGYGWTIKSVEKHYVNVVKYEPLNGSSIIILPTRAKKRLQRVDKHTKQRQRVFQMVSYMVFEPSRK